MEELIKNKELKDIRKQCAIRFNYFLSKQKSNEIEKSVFNYVIKYIEDKKLFLKFDNNFKSIYLIKIVSIYNNLNPHNKSVKNNYLYDQIRKKKINLENIAFMKPEELYPERWSTYVSKKRAVNNYLYKEQKYAETDEFKCMKCKQRKCKYYTIQIRSCDEPETIKIECLNCGNKWNE
jgi:transcription elongation factor S-II